MEITRQPTLGLNVTRQTASASQGTAAAPGQPAAVAAVPAVKPALEQIQAALGQLPQVDLDKVAAIKAALANGELASDSASLAAAMVTYHRGSHR